MTTLLSICSLILILWTLPLRAGELTHEDSGGWSGNGGGPNRVQDNVWFLGEEPVRYCLRLGLQHPLSMTTAHAMIQRSFVAWQKFFQKYQIGPGRVTDPRLQGLYPQMSLAFTPVSCPEAELEIYLGADNESIRLYREMNESDGPGLALRRSYDHRTHRHQGYIWIQNFTQDPRKVEHILLHELGHIFGMKHDSVFVMDRRIGPWLQKVSDTDPALRFLGKIEADFWPFDLLPGSRVTLVPYARQLPPAGRNMLQPSCPSGMISLGQIPSNFSPNIWPASGCVRLLLQKNRENDALNFQLNMTQENGAELLILFGNFAPSEPDNRMPMVPGTQSNWQNVPRSTSEWIYVPYGQRSMHARLSGYFIRGQTRYPAKLSWEEGLTLEIFIPDQARWWSIRSFGEGAT
jgi:hypothetical protein